MYIFACYYCLMTFQPSQTVRQQYYNAFLRPCSRCFLSAKWCSSQTMIMYQLNDKCHIVYTRCLQHERCIALAHSTSALQAAISVSLSLSLSLCLSLCICVCVSLSVCLSVNPSAVYIY